MSRFILLPTETKNSFTLVSTEDCMKTKTVEIPDELIDVDILKKYKIVIKQIIFYIAFLEVEFQKLQMVVLKMEIINIIYNSMKL